MSDFIQGKQLARLFFEEIVQPILNKYFPSLSYAAGLLGAGSEVLDFDSPRSTDHDWGPRLMIFLQEKDIQLAEVISTLLSRELPITFKGYSTHFSSGDPNGVQVLQKAEEGSPLNHRVALLTIKSFFQDYLGINMVKKPSLIDWLCFSEHKLKTIAEGAVFYDQIGLESVQQRFSYYPDDIWLFMMASEWKKIGEEEAFLGRAGEVGDELGSRIIASRLIHSIMRLCFLMERIYVPYSKWFGTAFSKLSPASVLIPVFHKVLSANSWQEREQGMTEAYEYLAFRHNKLMITKPIPAKVSAFHDRPFLVIQGADFADALKKEIKDKFISNINLIGSVNQLTHTVDLLENNDLLEKMNLLYK